MDAHDAERPPERDIELRPATWAHILRRHPELAEYREDILAVTQAPEAVTRDRRFHNRWRFYRSGMGPSRWLAVVVDFTEDPARVVTAHGFRKEHPR